MCLTALLFYCYQAFTQTPGSSIPDSKDKNTGFLDSLKVKASKNRLTKKLYDYVIVTPDTIIKNRITGTSEANFIDYSGKRIRNIEVRRLNVFGVNMNNPESGNSRKIDNLLNKTHINTAEKIIRKNLLFSTGDKISPLLLSDNERILRQLPYIDDARIIIVPISNEEADIVVLTKDVYSLGGSYTYQGLKKGSVSVFEKNILGFGHELGIDIPFDIEAQHTPGFGAHYTIDNLLKSFVNLNLFFLNGLDEKTYGFSFDRRFVSSTTKYAFGISVRQRYTTTDLDTLPVPEPLKFNLQDYWFSRAFLIDKEGISRIIIGGRYTNNNVYDRPFILPDSYYDFTKYRLYLASVAFSIQKYYKTNLIYGYGRTEDIPYGGLIRFTVGKERNEFNGFRERTYMGAEIAVGKSSNSIGYFYTSAGLATYLNGKQSRKGLFTLKTNYFSNLFSVGNTKMRNFVNFEYTRGFDRNSDEFLCFESKNGFSGFKNDSTKGTQRLSLSLESVLFSPVNYYGFRFAFFGFADISFLSGSNEQVVNGSILSGLGIGIRIRNDNLVFNTFQLRLGFFPYQPSYSSINHVTVSGEQLLRPNNFDPGPPSIVPYR